MEEISVNFWGEAPIKFTGIIYCYSTDVRCWFIEGIPFMKDVGASTIFYYRDNGTNVDSFERMFDLMTTEQKEVVIWNLDQWILKKTLEE